ncbi:MAG: MFS transporter [Pyrinomonadaceae bacterium]|nr:MFS transporter [Pyrinomonadaceae bacterium]MCX7640026.1 MFS transporter [Pyrinomonadaceae bacterium]MDW8304198.1 MFS transporter [Acidobacteriota bacterium]
MLKQENSWYAWYVLFLLTFVYVLNFVDRTIILYLFPLIKREFTFTDLQLSLLGTTAFVIFYTTLGIFFGRLADRTSRVRIIAFGLALWSLFTGLTGFAWDFWSIFFCRVMVGIGEATLGPAAISLLADYFPPSKRATVTSIYSMGIALGAGFAAFFGGLIGEVYGWRAAFYLLGFPGVLVAIFVYLIREPTRTSDSSVIHHSSNNWRALVTNKAFILLCLGYAFLGLATNNLSIWGATFYNRLHGFDLKTIGFWGGLLTLLGGIPATIFGGQIADFFRQRVKGGRMLYGSLVCLLCVPFWILWLTTDEPFLILLANGVLLFLSLSWLGAAAADATEIAGSNLRGLATAIYFFSVNIAAYLVGSNLIGYLSDLLGATDNPGMMRYSLAVCPISCLLGATCLWLGSQLIQKNGSQ